MCGIAGFFSSDPVAPAALAAAIAELRRRGPDSQHVVGWDAAWRRVPGDPPAQPVNRALLHARLAIIDPRPDGDQPMANARGDVWILYNGEVYGWADDARALAARGAVFRTRTDTEYILHAYEARGIDCLADLRGMFALAILDLRTRKLWLARDRMGKKPVVYHHGPRGFAFASTVRALRPLLPSATRRFSADAIDAYLAHRYVPAPMTVFDGVARLPNGHWLCHDLDSGAVDVRAWWTPRPRDGDWLATLDEAVVLRTVADRPLGVFLSGGIDSSVIASRLARHGHQHLATFTAAFPGTPFDESAGAARVAAALGFPNQAVPLPADAGPDFAAIVRDFDEPFADPSAFPTWYLARETTRQVKVVLSGDGGDELFAGYKRYDKHLRSRWRRAMVMPALPQRASLAAAGSAKWLTELRMSWLEAYSLRFSGFAPAQRRFLQPGRPPARMVWWRLPDGLPADGGADPLSALLAVDMLNYLPEYILRKSDLATMAHGLEARAPLLDHALYEVVLALAPARRFTRPPKRLLAEALALPPDIDLFAGGKRGFNPPVGDMLRGSLANRMPGLGARLSALTGGQLEATRVDTFVAAFRGGDAALAEQLLQLLILDESLAQLGAPVA